MIDSVCVIEGKVISRVTGRYTKRWNVDRMRSWFRCDDDHKDSFIHLNFFIQLFPGAFSFAVAESLSSRGRVVRFRLVRSFS